MTLYVLLAIIPLIIMPIVNTYHKSSINTNDRAKKMFLLCCGVCLFIMIAFRNRYVGSVDSNNYYNNWLLLRQYSFAELKLYLETNPMEDGYLFLVWVLSHIIAEPQFLFVITGLLFAIAVCRFIYKNSEDVQLSFIMFICLGLYVFMAQGLRQALAMSICLFAFEYCKTRKPIRFVLLVLLAMLFHKTAIVFVIVYLMYYLKMNMVNYIAATAAGLVVLVFSSYISQIGNLLFEREYETAVEGGGFVAVLIYIIILCAACIFASQKKKNKNFVMFFYMTFVGFVTYLLRYTSVNAAERISYYFQFGQIILLPSVINNFDKSARLIIKIVVIILSIFLFIYRLSSSNLLDYYFFWQEYPIV